MKTKRRIKWFPQISNWVVICIVRVKKLLKQEGGYVLGIKDPATLVIAIASVVIAYNSYKLTGVKADEAMKRMDAELKASNKAVVLVSQKTEADSIRLTMWNVGPGVAYNVKVNVHLVDRFVDVGAPWVANLIRTAIELETKTAKERNNSSSFSYVSKYTINPPEILPAGKEYSYNSSRIYKTTMAALYLEISYNDAANNAYVSIWDGMSWTFTDKLINDSIIYCTRQSLLENYYGILDDALSPESAAKYGYTKWAEEQKQMPYGLWLAKEAYFLKRKGFGDIPEGLQYYVQHIDTSRYQ